MKRLLAALFLLVFLFASPALACDLVKRTYGTATTIDLNLWLPDGTAHYTSTAPIAGDILFSKDEGAEGNCSTGSGACITDEGSFYSIAITGTELTTARLHIEIHDVSGAAWLDKCIIVETYNNGSAQHNIPDVNVASTSAGALAAASFAAGAIDASAIAADAIGASELAADSIGASELAANAVGSSELADTLTVSITGDLSGSVGSVVGNVAGSVVGPVASVTGNVGGNVVGGVLGSVTGSVGSVTGNVGGNLTGNVLGGVVGSVGSVVGAVGSVAGAVGSVTGACGSVTGSVGGNVNGNLNGTVGGMSAASLKDFFDTNSTSTFGASVAGSVVSEIASNCAGGGGGGGGACTSLSAGAITSASFGPDTMWAVKTAQAITATTAKLAVSDANGKNAYAETTDFHIVSGVGKNQTVRICRYDDLTNTVTFCNKLQKVPTGTVTYVLIPNADK